MCPSSFVARKYTQMHTHIHTHILTLYLANVLQIQFNKYLIHSPTYVQ